MDVIEAGFPVASEGDFQSVKAIATKIGSGENPPIICGLARTLRKDIEAAAEAVNPARFPRIHTFIASSDIHMEHKLRKTRSEVSLSFVAAAYVTVIASLLLLPTVHIFQVIDIVREMVAYAHSLVKDIEFSAEDAFR